MDILSHEIVESTPAQVRRTAFLLHGILGSRRNWGSMARRLAEDHPSWRFVVVDLRGHGDSHGLPAPHTLEACAADLHALGHHLGRAPEAVIGHSFGAKVALVYGRTRPENLQFLWSLDSPPGGDMVASTMSVTGVIEAARSAPIPFAHRLAAVPYFEALGYGRAVAAWMTTNLRREEGGFVWRFDLALAEALLSDYAREDLWAFLEDPGRQVQVNFVLAGQGSWWRGSVSRRLMALERTRVHSLDQAGHWVHIDDPDGLLAALSTTL